MKKIAFISIALLFMLAGCHSGDNREKLVIASIQADCVGVAPMKCMLVKRVNQPDWEFFYNTIEGFTYEPGYEYVVEIRSENVENPAADQSSIRYILVKQISKEKKESENLPDHLNF